jgi:3-methylcrotonyl-CoA carboxylase alpha subunit
VPRTLKLKHGGTEYGVTILDEERVLVGEVEVPVKANGDGSVRIGSPGRRAWPLASGSTRWVFVDGRVFEFEVQQAGRVRRRGGGHHGSLSAPMPATVRRINVKVGDRVERGATLLILEAMKMELPVKSQSAGVIEAVNCQEGELVQPGTALIEIEEADEA